MTRYYEVHRSTRFQQLAEFNSLIALKSKNKIKKEIWRLIHLILVYLASPLCATRKLGSWEVLDSMKILHSLLSFSSLSFNGKRNVSVKHTAINLCQLTQIFSFFKVIRSS